MYSIYWKNPHISRPIQFKPMLFKGRLQLYSLLEREDSEYPTQYWRRTKSENWLCSKFWVKFKTSTLWKTMSRGWEHKPQTGKKISAKNTSIYLWARTLTRRTKSNTLTPMLARMWSSRISIYCGWESKMIQPLWKTLGVS